MSTATLDPRTILRAKQQARVIVNKILGEYTKGDIRTYADIERKYSIELPGFVDNDAKNQTIVAQFYLRPLLDRYVNETEQRLLAADAVQLTKPKLRITPQDQCYTFTHNPAHRLYPEQDPVARSLYNDLFNDPTKNWRTAWCNGKTGSGKTEIINAILDMFIADKRYINPLLGFQSSRPIIWFTVTNARWQTEQKARQAGLGFALDQGILHVIPYSALHSSEGEGVLWTVEEETDPFTEQTTYHYNWMPSAFPELVVFDEAQKLKNPETSTTKRIQTLDEFIRQLPAGLARTKFLFFTATLAEKINDTRQFVVMSDVKFEGQLITPSNFNPQFAQIIANGRPDLPTRASMDRFRKFMSHRLYEIPKVRWPFQAIIKQELFDFLTAQDRAVYDGAIAEYLEQIEKLGRERPCDRALRAIALVKLHKKCEPIRGRQVAERMYADVQRGETAIMGTRFTGTIIKSIFHLIDTYNISRDDFSVVWGGRENVQPERLLGAEEIMQIVSETLKTGEPLDKKTFRLIKLNLAWAEDRLLFGDESEQAQNERYSLLKSLKLIGIQTLQQRQYEIDKFMSGRAKYCFITSASGGTGLSLEHYNNLTSRRNMYTGPIYSGMEFTQLCGRPHRRNSISDTNIFICLMNRSIESEHVGPIMATKLDALAAGSSFKDDLADVLINLTAEEIRRTQSDTFKPITIKVDEIDEEIEEDEDED